MSGTGPVLWKDTKWTAMWAWPWKTYASEQRQEHTVSVLPGSQCYTTDDGQRAVWVIVMVAWKSTAQRHDGHSGLSDREIGLD